MRLRHPLAIAGTLVTIVGSASCGREVTELVGPGARQAAFALAPYVPELPVGLRASDVAPFTGIRVHLTATGSTVQVDTVVTLSSDSVVFRIVVPLPAGTPSSGLPMTLNLAFFNATQDTVFRAGPVTVTAVPASAGTLPTPAPVPITYVGTGAGATSVDLTPLTGAGRAGTSSAFSAVARDALGQPIAGTPILFFSPDTHTVVIGAPGSATVTWRARRGSTKIVAALLTGPADTALIDVDLPPSRLEIVAGNGQTRQANQALLAPLLVRALASDDIAVPDVSVAFTVASGGGSVAPALAVTDAAGEALTNWTLGATIGAQTVTVSSSGVAALTFTANATAGASLGMAFVANANSSDVTVITTATGETITINCTDLLVSCSEPRNPTINAAGTLVAVPFRFSGNVLLLDPALSEFTEEIADPSFNEPYAAAFTADGTELWVANKFGGGSDTGTVTIVNVATRTVVAVVTDSTIHSPEGIAISNGRAYLANRNGSTLTVIDVGTRLVVARVALTPGTEPRHVIGTPNGQFVYASTGSGSVEKISTATNTVVAVIAIPSGGSSRNLSVRPDGAFVYVAMQSQHIGVVNVATNTATALIVSPGGFGTYGVAMLADGTLGLVTDENTNEVFAFDPVTNTLISGGVFPVTAGNTPRGIIAR